jgi:N-ethylmaleimide reductase
MNSNVDLFSPLHLESLTLPNRIIMSSPTDSRAGITGINGIFTPFLATYYAQRSTAGLIIATADCSSSSETSSSKQIARWQRVTKAVHVLGGRIFMELRPSVASSAIHLPTAELSSIVEQYRQSAENYQIAGFDGVEIDGTSGSVIDQFLQANSNQRTDLHGGSIENRARILIEIIVEVVKLWGNGRVGVKLDLRHLYKDLLDSNVVTALNFSDLAYLHIMETNENETDLAPQDSKIPTGLLRSIYKGPLMVSGNYDQEKATKILAEGLVDLVSFNNLFITNPDLPLRFLLNIPLTNDVRSLPLVGGPI